MHLTFVLEHIDRAAWKASNVENPEDAFFGSSKEAVKSDARMHHNVEIEFIEENEYDSLNCCGSKYYR